MSIRLFGLTAGVPAPRVCEARSKIEERLPVDKAALGTGATTQVDGVSLALAGAVEDHREECRAIIVTVQIRPVRGANQRVAKAVYRTWNSTGMNACRGW